MLYRANLGSPGNGNNVGGGDRNLKEKRHGLGRLDSGIDLELSLGSNTSGGAIRPDDFLVVHPGDVFKPVDVPDDKKLIYVEKINSMWSVEEQFEDGIDSNGVFNMDDVNCNQQDTPTIIKGYIPAKLVEIDLVSSPCQSEIDGQYCSSCGCSTCFNDNDDKLPSRSLVKKLEDENKSLKAQIQELSITNNSLLDSLSWNGDDDRLGLSALKLSASPHGQKSPCLLKSPIARSIRSRTITSDSSEADSAEILFKGIELPVVKEKETVLEEDLMLSCTLCSRKINHMAPDVLLVNVTQVNFSSPTDQLLKVITKTTMENFDGHIFEVNRKIDDFVWLREMLQRCCPSRIVPCLQLHGNVNGNFRGVERFLSRLSFHKVLKSQNLVKEFLSLKDIEPLMKQYNIRYPLALCSSSRYDNVSIDESSLLYKAKQYLSSLLERLTDLTEHLRKSIKTEDDTGSISERFKAISEVENNETYLKIAASGLSRITQKTTKNEDESYEAALVEELESVIGNIKEALQLLKRVEVKTTNFLYWKEEMKLYEEESSGKNKTGHGSKATCTKKWAEASANVLQAKSSLENICKSVSEELTTFDFMKEQDLKQILIDFADGQFQTYEKVESGQQIIVSLALSISYFPANSKFPASTIYMLYFYTIFQVIAFVITAFGLLTVTSQGRHYRQSLPFWTVTTYIISVIQIIYLFYVVAYFNRRAFSIIALSLVVIFVPKNVFFAFVVRKYHKLLNVGFFTADYDELELTRETWRRSRAGSSARDSIKTMKETTLVGIQEALSSKSESNLNRKVSTNLPLKAIPELSESKDSSEGDIESDKCFSIKPM
eukprot:gene3477-3975_t